jgi:hypothetical protein
MKIDNCHTDAYSSPPAPLHTGEGRTSFVETLPAMSLQSVIANIAKRSVAIQNKGIYPLAGTNARRDAMHCVSTTTKNHLCPSAGGEFLPSPCWRGVGGEDKRRLRMTLQKETLQATSLHCAHSVGMHRSVEKKETNKHCMPSGMQPNKLIIDN